MERQIFKVEDQAEVTDKWTKSFQMRFSSERQWSICSEGPIVKVKVTQSCLTLCDPMDYTVHGILQARILEWVAVLFSRGSSQPRDQTQVSCIAGRFFTSWATRKALIDCLFLELSSYILDPADWGKTTSVWMGKWNSKFKWFRDLY